MIKYVLYYLLARHIYHLLSIPLSIILLIEPEHVGKQGRPDKPFSCLGVMQKPAPSIINIEIFLNK